MDSFSSPVETTPESAKKRKRQPKSVLLSLSSATTDEVDDCECIADPDCDDIMVALTCADDQYLVGLPQFQTLFTVYDKGNKRNFLNKNTAI